MSSENAYELLVKGKEFLSQRHPHQAAIVLERASKLEPEKTSIREALARALFNSGQLDKASKQFERVIELDPSNDYAYFGLGMCQARLGDVKAARGQLKIAIVMKPDNDSYRQALKRLPTDDTD